MTRHLSRCAVVFWHFTVASTCSFHRVCQLSVTRMNIWKPMADGNLITHSKHQDYVDETETIEIILGLFPHTDMMHACVHTYQACICIHRQLCFHWSIWWLFLVFINPMSGDFVSSRSQIHVFISIPIDFIVFSLLFILAAVVFSFSSHVLQRLSSKTNWNWSFVNPFKG